MRRAWALHRTGASVFQAHRGSAYFHSWPQDSEPMPQKGAATSGDGTCGPSTALGTGSFAAIFGRGQACRGSKGRRGLPAHEGVRSIRPGGVEPGQRAPGRKERPDGHHAIRV